MVLLMCDLDNSTAVPDGGDEIEFMRGDFRYKGTLPQLRPGFILALQEKRHQYGDRLKFSLLPSHEQSFLDEQASKFIPDEIIDGYMPELALSSRKAPGEVQLDLYRGILGDDFIQDLKEHPEWQEEVFADGRLENYRRIVEGDEPAIRQAVVAWAAQIGGTSLSVGYVDDLPTARLLLNKRGYWVERHAQSTFGIDTDVDWSSPAEKYEFSAA